MGAEQFGQAFAAGDVEALSGLITDDVVFHSPVIENPGFEGRASVEVLFGIIRDDIADRRLVHELEGDGTRALVFDALARGKPFRATLLLELADDGRVREIWAMARPLTGSVAIAATIGSGLVERRRAGSGTALRATMKPLAGYAATINRIAGRIIGALNRETAQPG